MEELKVVWSQTLRGGRERSPPLRQEAKSMVIKVRRDALDCQFSPP